MLEEIFFFLSNTPNSGQTATCYRKNVRNLHPISDQNSLKTIYFSATQYKWSLCEVYYRRAEVRKLLFSYVFRWEVRKLLFSFVYWWEERFPSQSIWKPTLYCWFHDPPWLTRICVPQSHLEWNIGPFQFSNQPHIFPDVVDTLSAMCGTLQ